MVKESKLLDSKLKKGAKLDLIYRGSRDGFTGHVFHSKCDGMGPTLTVIKPSHNNNIFGGYTEHTWSSTGSYSSQPAWLFSLRNARDDTAYKFLPSTASSHAYNNGSYGPTFGGGHDLHVHSNMAGDQNYTNPSTFVTSAPGFPSARFTKELFAGQYKWAVGEIEVFLVHMKTNWFVTVTALVTTYELAPKRAKKISKVNKGHAQKQISETTNQHANKSKSVLQGLTLPSPKKADEAKTNKRGAGHKKTKSTGAPPTFYLVTISQQYQFKIYYYCNQQVIHFHSDLFADSPLGGRGTVHGPQARKKTFDNRIISHTVCIIVP
eukprot:g62659.t1